jgi:hypothetical protein
MFSESITSSAIEDDSCMCAKCGSRMRRLARKGFLQSKLFPIFGYYPWECFTCRSKKLMRSRGTRAFHRIWDDSWIETFEPGDEPAPDAPGALATASEACQSDTATCEAYSSPETAHSQAAPPADA